MSRFVSRKPTTVSNYRVPQATLKLMNPDEIIRSEEFVRPLSGVWHERTLSMQMAHKYTEILHNFTHGKWQSIFQARTALGSFSIPAEFKFKVVNIYRV